MLLNNMCEQFDSCILNYSDKPIITMLENIKAYLIKRMAAKRVEAKLLEMGLVLELEE